MEATFLLELSLILIVTKALGLLMKRFHLPQVIAALITGVLVGPSLLGWVHPTETMSVLADIGVILLMFTAGLESDLKKLKNTFAASFTISLIGFLAALAGGFFLSWAFGFPLMHSLFMGVILTATSVSITVETLQEMGKISTETGTAIMGAAVIDDILGILMLSFIMGSSGSDASFWSVGLWLLVKIAVFFAASYFLGIVIFKFIDYLFRKRGISQCLAIFSLGFCFFLSFLAEELGMAAITGAYMAGIALCNAKAEKYIEKRTHILSYLFFSPIFFISVGLSTTFAGLGGQTLFFTFCLLLVAILTKYLGCGIGSKIMGFNKQESSQIAVGMIARGELTLIIAAKGLAMGFIEPTIFSGIILMVILTTILTPIFLALAYKEKKSPKPLCPANEFLKLNTGHILTQEISLREPSLPKKKKKVRTE